MEQSLASELDGLRGRVDDRLLDLHAARKQYRASSDEWKLAETAALDAEEAQRVCQMVAQAVQQQAHDRIAGVVSRCLEAVFDEPYEFKILFEQKRGRTEASLVFVRGDQTLDPLTASGGGVVDVAAFALRVSCLLLARPALRRVLVLDEPLKFVSEQYRPRARAMIEKLAEDLGIQFIIVTHDEAYKTGKVVEL